MTRERQCAFCRFNATSATLVNGTPICWRPCYAALLKMQGGGSVSRALVDAFAEVPRGLAERDYMETMGWDAGETAARLTAYLWGVPVEVAAMLVDGSARRALPAGAA